MNSLIIVADASRARLFRTAQTTLAEAPVELVEIASLDASDHSDRDSHQPTPGEGRQTAKLSDDTLRRLSTSIAGRAAQFAHYHFCNPVIVVASLPVSAAIFAELERELPNAHVRQVTDDLVHLPPRELVRRLQERAAFTPLPARTPGIIAL